MLTRGRILGLLLLLVILAGAYAAWLALQVRSDLADARSAADELRTALDDDDDRARDAALADLQSASASAKSRTDDARWGVLTVAPIFGDDAEAVQVLSRSLEDVSHDGIPPLVSLLDGLDGVMGDGGVDLDRVRKLSRPVGQAADVFARSDEELSALDRGGLLGAVAEPLQEYAGIVSDGSDALASADKALGLAPAMLGGDDPRTYLLVFQNNAEIRATGGLPGSWAALRVRDGKLSLGRQGAGADFGERAAPVLPLTPEERDVYGPQLGTFFVDANFTPDFPRAAELMAARWSEKTGLEADGVVSLDPVAMSYLMKGTGAVPVAGRTLTSDNVLGELLNRPYLELEQDAQDAYFRVAARAIFDSVTGDLKSPEEFFRAVVQAASERRLLVAPFDPDEAEALEGESIGGALAGDDGATPHVDVALNDATGSKMSYYLRYDVDVKAQTCSDARQSLTGRIRLRQTIDPKAAASLPPSVTGGGNFGTAPGSQFVRVLIYGPSGGTVHDVRINGKRIDTGGPNLQGRPVASAFVLLDSIKPDVVAWRSETGPGQVGNTQVRVTPGIQQGSKDTVVTTSC